MFSRKPTLLLAILAVTALALVACGAKSTNTAQGDAIFETRGNVASREGLFQRGDSEATIQQKADSNNLVYRKLEVANFIAGTRNEITVAEDQSTTQPYVAFAFLPTELGQSDGLMVIVKRDNDVTQAVLGFNCDAVKFYLGKANVTDFTNEVCS